MSFSLSTLLTNTEHTTDVQGLFRHMMAHYRDVYMQGRGPSARVSLLSSSINFESLIDLNSTPPVPGAPCARRFHLGRIAEFVFTLQHN